MVTFYLSCNSYSNNIFTSNLPVKNKEVNIQSQLAVTMEHKFEPCLQSFDYRPRKEQGTCSWPFLNQYFLQKSSHSIFGSTVYTLPKYT